MTSTPLTLELLSDDLTAAVVYARLTHTGQRAFLLESVGPGHVPGRYSYLGVDPLEVLRITDGQFSIEGTALPAKLGVRVQKGNPQKRLETYLARLSRAPEPDSPPFNGGAVGYLSYEYSGFLEEIPKAKSRVHEHEAHFMIFKNVIVLDHARNRLILIANIFPELESPVAGNHRANLELERLCLALGKRSPRERLSAPLQLNLQNKKPTPPKRSLRLRGVLGRKQYIQNVLKIKKHIRKGDLFQCVLSDQFKIPFSRDPLRLYRELRSINPSPYHFLLQLGTETLVGASPELLTQVEGGTVKTAPIAGTRKRGKDRASDMKQEQLLLKSPKERAEHLMLVDLGRNDIGKISKPGTVTVTDFMHVQRFSHVMHLVSHVSGKIKAGVRPMQALHACFPAGTLSGAPKVSAMKILSSLEPVQRGVYGGAIVILGFSGRLDSCITIRSIYLRDGNAYLRAGAGIVADSRPEAEYAEVLSKARATAIALERAGGGA